MFLPLNQYVLLIAFSINNNDFHDYIAFYDMEEPTFIL